MRLLYTLIILLGINTLYCQPPHHNSEPKTVYIKLDWSYGFWPQKELRAAFAMRGYQVQEVHSIAYLPDMAYLIAYDVPMQQLKYLAQYPREKCILVTWEPPVVKSYNFAQEYQKYFGTILTWYDAIVDNTHIFKCNYTVWQEPKIEQVLRQPKKLCTLIATNKDSSHPLNLFAERKRLVDAFNAHIPDEFDLYGNGWDAARYPSYRGRSGDKYETLQQYKFCICYENTAINGYITEKIFDAFIAGVIPIYKGAPNIADWIPTNCFINPDTFATPEQLVSYVQNMTDKTYREYQERIKTFMHSSAAQKFSNQEYVNVLMRAIFGDTA